MKIAVQQVLINLMENAAKYGRDEDSPIYFDVRLMKMQNTWPLESLIQVRNCPTNRWKSQKFHRLDDSMTAKHEEVV